MTARRYYRSTTDRKLFGVCGGLAEYFQVDVTLVRVAWIVLTIASVGLGLLAYLVLWLAAPEGPSATAATTELAPAR